MWQYQAIIENLDEAAALLERVPSAESDYYRFNMIHNVGKWIEMALGHLRLIVRESEKQAERKNKISLRQAKEERKKLTRALRFKMLQRDNFTCRGCGRSPLRDPDVQLCVDHIHPVAHGGKTIESNLQVLCFVCNAGKSDRLAAEMARAV